MTDTVPAWLTTMRAITGTKEVPGPGDNPVILAWPKAIAARFPDMAAYCANYQHDETAWCGLTCGYVMAMDGIRPPYDPSNDLKSFLWAQAWKEFGDEVVGDPQPGDVVVFARHVTLFERVDGSTYVCRGGNQSDQVKESSYSISAVEAIRRPRLTAVTTAPSPSQRQVGITATMFGGPHDEQPVAYGDVAAGWDQRPGVALPYRFNGVRPQVRVFANGRSLVCPVVDVGPWNVSDAYWEHGARPQAESGIDTHGRHTNKAGIDLTPATAKALGIDGKGVVDWEFAGAAAPVPATSSASVPDLESIKQALLALHALNTELAPLITLLEKIMTDVATAAPAPAPVPVPAPAPAPAPQPFSVDNLARFAQVIASISTALATQQQPQPAPAPVALPAPAAPAATPAKSTAGFGTGILGVIVAAIAHQQGFIAAPVGEGSSLIGLLSFVLPIALSAFGVNGGVANLAVTALKLIAGAAAKK